jgi:hypothetical protein
MNWFIHNSFSIVLKNWIDVQDGDEREWSERRVEILSVGVDIPRRELGTATAI